MSSFDNGGWRISLQRLVAEHLLNFRGVDPASVSFHTGKELHEAVSLLMKQPDINLQDLYCDVSDALDGIVNQADFQLPPALDKLPEISDFHLIVTLSPDNLIAKALKTRYAVNEIIHSPYLPTSEVSDLAQAHRRS